MLNKKVDKYLNVFGFFLAYPCFYILDSSFTFFLFLLILINLPKDSFVGFIKVNNIGKKAMAFLPITAFLSLLFAPWYDIELTIKPFKLLIQLIYWNFLVFFIIEFFETIKCKAFFSGGAFDVKSKNLHKNFNMQHFDLYENNLGMGEDGLFGFSFSLNNKSWVWEKFYLIHNDFKHSTYAVNLVNSSNKYLYSRLNLNYEYYRLKNKQLSFAFCNYHHFEFFKLLSALFICITKNKKAGKEIFIGHINAIKLSFAYSFKLGLSANLKWKEIDIEKLSINK
jgi:hypothetical protein